MFLSSIFSGNLKVAYGSSKHRQRSAPNTLLPEHLPDVIRLEEMFCESKPHLVNTFLLRPNWGSGSLQRCRADGSAIFAG